MTKQSLPARNEKHELAMANADIATESVPNAALTIQASHGGNADLETLICKLDKQVGKVVDGDTRRIETMLMTQAQTLDAIFHKLMKSAFKSEYVSQLQVYADIALKAQNQSRKALMALTEIKHPHRTTFIKQQNNAVNQQVNNQSENLKKFEKSANELLSEKHHETMDISGAPETITIDSPMAALEKVKRRKKLNRKE